MNAAEILEGQGTICITQQRTPVGNITHCLRISVTTNSNTNEILQTLLPYGGSLSKQGPTLTRWTITSNQASAFLKTILPQLNRRHQQAELAILFQETLQERKLCKDHQQPVDSETLATRLYLKDQVASFNRRPTLQS